MPAKDLESTEMIELEELVRDQDEASSERERNEPSESPGKH